MRKKAVVVFVIFLLISGFFFYRGRASTKKLFKTESVKKGEIAVKISSAGEIKAERDIYLKFQSSGLLSWVGVKKGDSVKKGQAIASLDKRQLEQALKKEANDYLSKRWDFEQTQDDYKETKERKLVTDAIRRILDKAQYDLENSVIDYELADLAVKLATIYSPFEGIVVELDEPYAGVNITPATARFRIVDPSNLYFEARIDEADISKVKIGDKVNIYLDAYPNEVFEGTISKIDFESTKTSGGGTAYNAWISFAKLLPTFRLGMNGEAEIIKEGAKEAFLAPLSAIFERDKKTYLWKLEDKKAKKIEVTTGLSDDNYVQILSGITEGDIIITSNINLLKEGISIIP